jgi:hypothetical protein
MAAVTTIPAEVDFVSVKIAELAARFTVFALSHVLSHLTLVYSDVAAVRANFTRVAAQVPAFRLGAILIAAPSRLMRESGLCSSRRSAREHQCAKCSDCFSFHVNLPAAGLLNQKRVSRAVAGIDGMRSATLTKTDNPKR